MTAITSEVVRELLDYDPETGVMIWRKRDRKWFKSDGSFATWNTRFAGTRAGNDCESGKGRYRSRKIGMFGRLQSEHRVVWLWMSGEPLPEQIDHVNRNATDNRWSNLRASSCGENSRNRSKYSSNGSGVTGVKWHAPNSKWLAVVDRDGTRHNLGSFSDIADAAAAVKAFRDAAGFDPSHGADIQPY